MANIRSAGSLHDKIAIDLVNEVEDDHGGFKQVKTTFETRAHIRYLRGGETVQAARLQGKQPVVFTVRRSSKTMQINTETIVRDARTGTVYNVHSVVPTEDRQFYEITAESGVAT